MFKLIDTCQTVIMMTIIRCQLIMSCGLHTHRVQEKLEMQEIGRHYYNPKLSTSVPQHK